ncbi:unnamed protein product (macronuclear) [Paramecium tetraurelia]|uniref:P-type ATPase A domain-containing protein n=1 Tax=Paramecium tetraurelia TaxID=5888 RepID=A0C697_PARTE|nr:uncharacterized protein GSPATT00035443001 [Paramecium tetraurelia]CAK66314.1 unnamed protein product [Paramecium tetraurelia]|eukprot:XP_001433711.1 hypothetical protein (macronuclear) [Paramecium tetraurelia strain d4-2]
MRKWFVRKFVQTTIPILHIGKGYLILNRFLKYQLKDNFFQPVNYVESSVSHDEKSKKLDVLLNTQGSREIRQIIYGNSQLQIPIKSIFTYLFQELTSPFYILQYFSVLLWIAEGFIIFAIVLLSFSFLACIINYYLMRRSRVQLQQLATIQQSVTLKDNSIIQGSDLVVGDLFYVYDNQQLNCDSILISGDVMVNEATLTGESIPVPKQSITELTNEISQNTLFEGTKVIQVSQYQQNIALVIRTGYSSVRGQYFRNVIFPPPPSRQFYLQACKFLVILGLIILTIFTLLYLTQYQFMNYSSKLIIIRYLDVVTWIVPPALPIFFSLAQAISLLRLKSEDIMGSNPIKAEEAGKIDTICFDKTGTLSTLGLQAHDYYPQNDEILGIMACCHHLVIVKDELMGDPLELEMFKKTNWDISFDDQKYFQVTNQLKTFKIIRIFEFSSQLQMMSVVAHNINDDSYTLFIKGSPEKLIQMSANQLNNTIQEQLQIKTFNGLRVIGLGYKALLPDQINLDRNVLENQINFSGIFTLENSLKKDTSHVIEELLDSNLDIRVISGDNALTTTHCAFESKIIENKSNTLIIDYDQSTDSLLIQDLRQQIPSSSRSSCDGKPGSQYNFILTQLDAIYNSDCNYAITGNLWSVLMQNKVNEVSMNQSSDIQQYNQLKQIDEIDQKSIECLNKVVRKTKIFSRMKPHQKKEIVQYLQNQLNKYVMMVGDGANDCSAIAESLVGVSFSSSDASYTSPFSNRSDSIKCVISILLQGRATKRIIIELFQYLVLISVLKFAGTALLQFQGMNFGDFQYIFMNYMSSVPVLILMTLSSKSDKLTTSKPNDDVFAIPNQLQFYNIFIFTSLGCIILSAIVMQHSEQPIPSPIETYTREGPLNSVMMLANQYYNMLICIILYQSHPFKSNVSYLIQAKFYQNYPLTIWILGCLLIAIVTNFSNPSRGWLSIVNINDEIFDHSDLIVFSVIICTSVLCQICQITMQKLFPTIKPIQK